MDGWSGELYRRGRQVHRRGDLAAYGQRPAAGGAMLQPQPKASKGRRARRSEQREATQALRSPATESPRGVVVSPPSSHSASGGSTCGGRSRGGRNYGEVHKPRMVLGEDGKRRREDAV